MPGFLLQVSPALNSHSALPGLHVTSCTARRQKVWPRCQGLGSVDGPCPLPWLQCHSSPSKDKGSPSSFHPCLALPMDRWLCKLWQHNGFLFLVEIC